MAGKWPVLPIWTKIIISKQSDIDDLLVLPDVTDDPIVEQGAVVLRG